MITHWRRTTALRGPLFLVLVLLSNEKLRSSGWISVETGNARVKCCSSSCGLGKPRGGICRGNESPLFAALAIVESLSPRGDLVIPSSPPRWWFTCEEVERAKEAAMRNDKEWYSKFIQGRESDYLHSGSVTGNEDGPAIGDSGSRDDDNAVVVGSRSRNKLLRLGYSCKEISELDKGAVELLLERNVCRPTSGIPNDWLRESVVVRHSRADDDFDGSGWDVESEGPRRTSTDDSHYDHGSKKSSREQQPSQIPQQVNFNNIYQVEREQHQDYHSHILDLLPTLDQFKCMLRKDDEMQLHIDGSENTEARTAQNKLRVDQYKRFLNSLETEEMKKDDKEQPEGTYQVKMPTNPAQPKNKESQDKATKSLMGHISDGFMYIAEALSDDKGDESAKSGQEDP